MAIAMHRGLVVVTQFEPDVVEHGPPPQTK
jgi:hypothetical protein